MNWSTSVEVGPDATVDWMYPNIYKTDPMTGNATPLSLLRIGLSHTRAANSFTIEYDSERDGYVLRMDRTRWEDGIAETIEEGVEVGFVPAWLETPTPAEPPPPPTPR